MKTLLASTLLLAASQAHAAWGPTDEWCARNPDSHYCANWPAPGTITPRPTYCRQDDGFEFSLQFLADGTFLFGDPLAGQPDPHERHAWESVPSTGLVTVRRFYQDVPQNLAHIFQPVDAVRSPTAFIDLLTGELYETTACN